MRITILLLAALLAFCMGAFAQGPKAGKPAAANNAGSFAAEKALADRVLAAHGGEKLRAMKTLVVGGSVDVTTSAIAQAIPATFVTVFAGDRYRIELNNPFQPFKQVYDGVTTASTLSGGFTLPPINRLGFPLLPRIGDQSFFITSLPDAKKGKKGFRITSPEGYFTDFYVDEKTDQVKGYDSSYEINGRTITTSVEIDKYRLVDGVLVPEKYAQRFDMGGMTVYAAFKAKEIKVNSPVSDEIFKL